MDIIEDEAGEVVTLWNSEEIRAIFVSMVRKHLAESEIGAVKLEPEYLEIFGFGEEAMAAVAQQEGWSFALEDGIPKAMATAYPLSRPAGRPRTPAHRRERANFGHRDERGAFVRGSTVARAAAEVFDELRRIGAGQEVVSTNVELRLDGRPKGGQGEPGDPGVAVYFVRKDQHLCIVCDRYDRVGDNLRAIAKTLAALRALERWGTRDTLEAAFVGFRALPPTGGTAGVSWWEVLGVDPLTATRAGVDAAFKALAQDRHPDRGGDLKAWHQLQEARRQAVAALATSAS